MLGTTFRRRTCWFPKSRPFIASAKNSAEASVLQSFSRGPQYEGARGRSSSSFTLFEAFAAIDDLLDSKSTRRSDNLQAKYSSLCSSTIQIKYSKGVTNINPFGCRFTPRLENNYRPKLFKFQQNRFTTYDSKNNKEEVNDSAVTSSSTSSTITSKPTDGPLETDFANFLTEAEKVDTIRSQSTTRRRNRSNAVFSGVDKDKEIYEHILKASLIQKEEARIRTATNVYRALCGNVVICLAKLGAWVSSGSSAILAEFIHSVVDCGNQSLLLVGLRDSRLAPDRKHPYGYGKSIYFWALVSALGTFFLGAGVSMTHAIGDLMEPSLNVITWEVWAVLAISFTVDGYVFIQTVKETYETKPNGVSYWNHLSNIRDPATLAILLEDGAACLGIVLAMSGILMTHATGNAVFDGIAGVAISSLLGAMGIALVRVNHRFLLGQAVDKEITDGIQTILLSRKSIDSIRSVQSQWTGPETFSYKAEVDFDGTYLAAKLMPIYQHEFLQIRDTMDEELQVLLALYAEDVMRTVEREVRNVEAQIRKQYPGAEYIELEPMSVDVDRLAIDDNLEADLKRVESDALNRYLKSLRSEASTGKGASTETDTPRKQ